MATIHASKKGSPLTRPHGGPAVPRGGRHWVVAAAVTSSGAVMLAGALYLSALWRRCTGELGEPPEPTHGPCGSTYASMALLAIAVYALAFTAVFVGLVVGQLEGRRRHLPAHGRWVALGVVGLTAPWAAVAYLLGYAFGRLLPASPRPADVRAEGERAWHLAVDLYGRLAAGYPPPTVRAPGFEPGDVYLDVPMPYSRFYGANVGFSPGTSVVVGHPAFILGHAVGSLLGAGIGRARAAQSRPQWREHCVARVAVTETATWCLVSGQWLSIEHGKVVGYTVDGWACQMTFAAGFPPLRLSGPWVWYHATLYIHLRHGVDGLRESPIVQALRDAAELARGVGAV